MDLALQSPFALEPVREVPLRAAPLVSVLAQVRFPKNPGLATEAGVAPLHQSLRRRYPILRESQQVGLVMTPVGVTRADPEKLWQLHDKSGDWTVSVTTGFATLVTSSYTSRTDFCERFQELLGVLQAVADPVIYDRIGLRYVNRFAGDALAQLPTLVRPEVLGGRAVPLAGSVELMHSFCDTQFVDGRVRQQVRWGSLPSDTSHDPSIPPAAGASWILDMDTFTDVGGDFEVEEIANMVQDFADRAYRFFRWAVTVDGLRFFGGQV